MAGIRGVKNPMPKKGKAPTNIFSRTGSQKKDTLSAKQAECSKYTGANYREPRIDPVKRNNGLK